MSASIVGTWHPAGYFGHFRSKTRNDIVQDYRHTATPNPPQQFTRWVRKSPDNHHFSKHDNRHSFPTDASYFDTGLGRRKAHRSITAFNPEFIAWIPHRDEIKREGSSVSLYRLDFQTGDKETSSQMTQRLSPRIRRRMQDMEANDAKQKWVTDYKRQFSHGQPNPRINTDLNTGKTYDGPGQNPRSHPDINKTGRIAKVVPPYLQHTRRRSKSAPAIRYSVGDCLVWNGVPATAPTVMTSHPVTNGHHLAPRPPAAKKHEYGNARNYAKPWIPNKDISNMTPGATAINTFTPVQSGGLPTIVTPEHTAVKSPVVVID